jgi:hypothetical protein
MGKNSHYHPKYDYLSVKIFTKQMLMRYFFGLSNSGEQGISWPLSRFNVTGVWQADLVSLEILALKLGMPRRKKIIAATSESAGITLRCQKGFTSKENILGKRLSSKSGKVPKPKKSIYNPPVNRLPEVMDAASAIYTSPQGIIPLIIPSQSHLSEPLPEWVL